MGPCFSGAIWLNLECGIRNHIFVKPSSLLEDKDAYSSIDKKGQENNEPNWSIEYGDLQIVV